jgi:hypothetical protein
LFENVEKVEQIGQICRIFFLEVGFDPKGRPGEAQMSEVAEKDHSNAKQ